MSNTFRVGSFLLLQHYPETRDILLRQRTPEAIGSARYVRRAAVSFGGRVRPQHYQQSVLVPSTLKCLLSQFPRNHLFSGGKFRSPPCVASNPPFLFTSSNERPEVLQETSAFLPAAICPRSSEAQGVPVSYLLN